MKECIFIHIPKNAGRSILSALGRPFSTTHKTILEYYKECGDDYVKTCFKFTCIRNPWDRAVSWWSFFCNMGVERIPFEDWLTKMGKRPRTDLCRRFPLDQMSYCRNSSGEILIDSFIRFEHLSDDWIGIAAKIGVSKELPKIGKQEIPMLIARREAMLKSCRPKLAPMIPTEDFRDMYTTQESIDLVRRMDSETIQRFGYEF